MSQDQVNSKEINELADFMETRKELKFNMLISDVPIAHRCGSAGCIGGFGAALWPNARTTSQTSFNKLVLRGILGLASDQVDALFYPQEAEIEETGFGLIFADTKAQIFYSDISRAGAIATLRRLAKTGEVEWREEEQTQQQAAAVKVISTEPFGENK